NFYTARARSTTQVAMITKEDIFSILTESPDMVLSLANRTIAALSPMVRCVDFALEWINMESGKIVYRQGTKRTAPISFSREDSDPLSTEVGSKRRRPCSTNIHGATWLALDSELCKVPGQLLHLLKTRYPVVVSKLISLLGKRLIGTWSIGPGRTIGTKKPLNESSQFTTVALFAAFAYELTHALTLLGSVTHISSSIIYDRFGPSALDSNNEFRLTSWLGQQEDRHDVVLYQCDNDMTEWSLRCLRQADVIFDIVLAASQPDITQREKDLEFAAKRIRKNS
ncbi:Uncharacterized protein FKW44_020827, partial [Caligus rogercresseyi]